MSKKKKNNDPFSALQGAAVGTASIGLTTAVGASIGAQAPAGSPSVTQGFNTVAGFVPVATTVVAGKSVLKALPKRKKNKWGY